MDTDFKTDEIRAAIEGDSVQQARFFPYLYGRFRLYFRGKQQTKALGDENDAASVAMLNVLRHLPKLQTRSRGEMFAWFFQAGEWGVLNAIRRLNRRKRKSASPDPTILQGVSTGSTEAVSAEPDPGRSAAQSDSSDSLRNAMSELTPEEQQVTAAKMAGQTNVEIAREFGWPEYAVSRLLASSMKKLKCQLKEGDHFTDAETGE